MRNLLAAAVLAAAVPAAAQDYPAKPIQMLMPLQAGSAVDAMLRIVAERMSQNMGRQIVVENQPGAAGMIGAERVKRAAPDGYTVGVLNDSILTMIPSLRKVPYDPVKDFVPVSIVAGIHWVMVINNEVPARNVGEFVALAKNRPGKLDYSSGGVGSPQHFAAETFKAATGTYLVHIPYRGATQAALDVIPGQVQMHLGAVSILLPHIKSGKVRALAVPSPKRSSLLPDVPTMAEAGVPGFDWFTWAAIMVPVGTPKPIVDRLHAETVKAVNDPGVREKLIAIGLEPVGSPPEQVTQWTNAGLKRMGEVVKRAGITME
jgi:tripartite-type tricarboxylate transporter receptor subunit TctC